MKRWIKQLRSGMWMVMPDMAEFGTIAECRDYIMRNDN